MAELMGDYPEHLLLIGVQPVELEDFGGSLRPQVKARIGEAIDRALDYLADFGVVPTPCAESDEQCVDGAQAALALASYESGRPSEALACRIGDARVLSRSVKA